MGEPQNGSGSGDTDAHRRAFVLGVRSALDRADPDRWTELRATAERAYERQLLDLAFEEGRAKAAAVRRKAGAEAAWERLVEETPTETDMEMTTDPRPSTRDGKPESLDRPSTLDRPDRNPTTTRFPRFIRRG
jgi:hypothetical protein